MNIRGISPIKLLVLIFLASSPSISASAPRAPILPEGVPGSENCGESAAPEAPWVVYGWSAQCRPIAGVTRGSGEEVVLLFGAFHGHETFTGPFVERFDRDVLSMPDKISARRKVIVIPYVNPDGWGLNTRTNASGVDINRNFPTRNWKEKATYKTFPPGPAPMSEPETRAVIKLIAETNPKLIVSVHSWLNMINYDGPARKTAREMSRISGLRLRKHVGYPTPGSLGTYAGRERRIPTITLELPQADSMDQFWVPVSEAVLYAINH